MYRIRAFRVLKRVGRRALGFSNGFGVGAGEFMTQAGRYKFRLQSAGFPGLGFRVWGT